MGSSFLVSGVYLKTKVEIYWFEIRNQKAFESIILGRAFYKLHVMNKKKKLKW